MMKRYLPVIFTIFAIIFTHGHAVAADVTPNAPGAIGCTVKECYDTTSHQEPNCAKTICKIYKDGQGREIEITSCEECNEGYTQIQKTATCGNMPISGLYKCDAPYINCTGKCNSCGPTTTTINKYYTKTINRSCQQKGTGCECVVGDTTYSCSSSNYQDATTVECTKKLATDTYSCAGCTSCPDNAKCDGSTKFKCDSGYYKPQDSNSCKLCPNNHQTCNNDGFTCKSGYYKSGDSCASCPAYSTCTSATNFTCNDRYYKSGSGCASCPANSTCTSATDFKCDNDYCKSGNKCEKIPENAKCVDGEIKCNKDYYKSGNSCKACGLIKIGNQTITATSVAGATSKSDCQFTGEISEERNGHQVTIKIKSCY